MRQEDIVGQVIEQHYRIIRPIGYGGMATVYLAEDILLQREVAIKVFWRSAEVSTDFLRYFAREARVLAQLDHPNILQVYDYGEQGGLAYLVMPYIAKGSLKDLLQSHPILSPIETIRLIAPILNALQYAHDHGLIHRDIKPGNMLFKAEGTLVLSDFGLVKVSSTAQTNSSFVDTNTTTNQSNLALAGTPEYMAPEQAKGQPTSLSDIYSIGVVLYEMLTGRRLFTADSVIGILIKHLYEQPRPLSVVNQQISPTLEAVVLRTIEKEASKRFQRATDLLQALTEATTTTTTAATTVDITGLPTGVLSAPTLPVSTQASTLSHDVASKRHDPEEKIATQLTTKQSISMISSLPTQTLPSTYHSRIYSSFGIATVLLLIGALLTSPYLFIRMTGQFAHHKNQSPLIQKLVLHTGSYTNSPVIAPSLADCPAAGTVRTPVVPPYTSTHHPSLIYGSYQSDTNYDALIRYDVTTGNQTELVKFAKTVIYSPQISTDGQWILFFTNVYGQTNADTQSKIQIVRVDGKDLQTLYCSDTGHTITTVLWSPNQQLIIFGTVDNGIGDEPPDRRLLNLVTGSVETILPHAYLSTVRWLDNTRLYLHTGGFELHLEDLLILDTSLGPNQQESNLAKAYISPDRDPKWDADLSPDASQLFVSQYAATNDLGGPSTIGKQPARGGTLTSFITTPLSITSIRAVTSTTLLLLSDNAMFGLNPPPNTTQYGLWKINTNGTGLTQLTIDKNGGQALNRSTQLPWSNVSRDGGMYALEDTPLTSTNTNLSSSTLLIGLLSGGPPLTFAPPSSKTSLEIAGWTTT